MTTSAGSSLATSRDTRVLMLTASDTIEDRVEGLRLGADDYLPKPFAFAELVARVRALARRAAPPLPPTLACGDITLDPARRTALRAGRRLDLSPKEFALLECLLAAPGAGPVRRGTARTSLGRGSRPLHLRGQTHHAPATRPNSATRR